MCVIYIFISKFISEYFTHSHLLLLNIVHSVLQHLNLPLSVAFTFTAYFMLWFLMPALYSIEWMYHRSSHHHSALSWLQFWAIPTSLQWIPCALDLHNCAWFISTRDLLSRIFTLLFWSCYTAFQNCFSDVCSLNHTEYMSVPAAPASLPTLDMTLIWTDTMENLFCCCSLQSTPYWFSFLFL